MFAGPNPIFIQACPPAGRVAATAAPLRANFREVGSGVDEDFGRILLAFETISGRPTPSIFLAFRHPHRHPPPCDRKKVIREHMPPECVKRHFRAY
jgi:hypothetical protein